MNGAFSLRALTLALLCPLIASIATTGAASSRYLFVRAMEVTHPRASTLALRALDRAGRRRTLGLGVDFLSVFDVRPGATFGELVAMRPVGKAVMAHHTNYVEPPSGFLYANDWVGNRTYVVDLCDPRHPRLARKFQSVYISRSAVATERLSLTAQGEIRCALKTPYGDGTTHGCSSRRIFSRAWRRWYRAHE